MPDYGIATPLVNTIKKPFQMAHDAIQAIPDPPQWLSSLVTPKSQPAAPNPYLDQMVQKANQSFLEQSQRPNLSTMKKPLGK